MKSPSTLVCRRTRIAAGIAFSLLIHALIVFLALHQWSVPVDGLGDAGPMPMTVHFIPHLSTPNVASSAVTLPPAAPKKSQPKKLPRQQKIAVTQEKAPPPAAKSLHATPLPADMSDMINAARARRRAAGIQDPDETASDSQAASDNNAIAAANVAHSMEMQSRGRNDTSGVFQITFKGVRTAEFLFRGWDAHGRANARQLVEVDAGLHGDIDLAIIRKMIALIRQYQTGDFNWDSHRLGRVVVLSARVEDTAGLEEFLKKEFFNDYR